MKQPIDRELGLLYLWWVQATLDELRLNAVYQLLENVIRYLPLRRPLRNFLVALRDWPIRMEFKKVTGQHYADKVSTYVPRDIHIECSKQFK